ncbi:MAG: phospholipid carrier-dependent glycosyltransferase [Candidatus Levyibacteriota bacterium]
MLFVRKHLFTLALILFFILGFILRFYKLETFPIGFHIDEASKGYSAYSILKTGHDDNGNFLPFYIDIFGDNSPAGYHYSAILPVALFGLTEFAVRSPGALFGALTIIAFYFFAYAIFQNKKISLAAAGILAISPWHIILSRASSESLLSLFFILLGFALVFWSLKSQRLTYLITGTVSLSISFLYYQTPRFFVPLMFFLFLGFVFFYLRPKISGKFKKVLVSSFLLLVLIDSLLIFGIKGGVGRFTQVNIFNYPETRLVMEEQIREDGVRNSGALEARFFHNKLVNNAESYLSNYLAYFSWNFLFLSGLPDWYFVPNMGALYIVELPFVLYGLIILATHKNRAYRIPLIWLVAAPLAAASAIDTNNLQRAIVMFPILDLIAAFGLFEIGSHISKMKYKILSLPVKYGILGIFGALFFLNFIYFLHEYFIHTSIHRPWYRNNGFKEMVLDVKKSYSSYDKIIVTTSAGGIYPEIQFYMQYDPRKYQEEGSPKDKKYSGFGKFFFVPEECPSLRQTGQFPKASRTLYINNGTCPSDERYKEVVVRREDGTPAFKMVYPDQVLLDKAKAREFIDSLHLK